MHLTIEKLIYGGDGLARAEQVPNKDARRKTVFVPFVLRGEQVEARIVEEKPGFARAHLEKILEASPNRIAPHCPYFQRCGGCHYQHTSYDQQLAIKRDILRETLERTAKIKWESEIVMHPSEPWGYRNRTRMKIAASPFSLGYYRHSSHDLLPVENCPISSPLINRAIEALWQMGRSGAFAESSVYEIEFFADHADAKLMLELYATESQPKEGWEKFVENLRSRLPAITSISVFTVPKSSRQKKAEPQLQEEYRWQQEPFIYETKSARYQVSPGSFFQTNRFLNECLTELVCDGAKGKRALDLYAGVGLFSAVLAKNFDKVEAVEIAPSSFNDLKKNVPRNVSVHRMTTAAYLKNTPLPKSIDLIVVDPPRAGLGEDVSRKLAQAGPVHLTYVSCDPATLARDLNLFLQSGYRLEQVHLVDLFPQTYHIETVVQLSRK